MQKNYATKYIGETVTIKIDRPMGSKHPKWDFVYPINYGEIPNTLAPDGEAIDAYILGISEPKNEFTGICIAVIHRTNDNDDKLIVVPKNKTYTDEQIIEITKFQEQFFESIILFKKNSSL
jgi:inorganic pyrophosphatase